MKQQDDYIRIRGARQHHLKNINLDIPLGALTVMTGPSGSGKSSLAMSTLYAEGQRRYVETFSPYVRQFMDRMDRPDVDAVENVPPAIALGQRNSVKNSRSTVGTMTALNEYLKLIFARLAEGHDAEGRVVHPFSPQEVADLLLKESAGLDALICFAIEPVGRFEEMVEALQAQGFMRVLVNGEVLRLSSATQEQLGMDSWLVLQDRVKLLPESRQRLMEAIEGAMNHGHDVVQIAVARDGKAWAKPRAFRSDWFPLLEPRPGLFSGNSPLGACPACKGYGRAITYQYLRGVDEQRSIADGALKMLKGNIFEPCYDDFLRANKRAKAVRLNTPWTQLSEAERDWVLYGEAGAAGSMDAWEASARGVWYGYKGIFEDAQRHAHKMSMRIFLSYYRVYSICPDCHGGRLRPEALAFTIAGKTVPEVQQMPMDELLPWVDAQLMPKVGEDRSLHQALREFRSRVAYLCEVGLGYITASRLTRSLSGGEIERVSLTTCLGASLTETLFVLDEPTVGLHARDTERLISAMRGLCDRGNSLVVVEHEESVMRAADYLVDLGPHSGAAGGEVVFAGRPEELEHADEASSTAQYLTGKRQIAIPKKRRKARKKLSLRGVCCHNLHDLDVDIPLGVYTCLTGVSGSGKSSLACQVLFGHVHPDALDDEDEFSIKSIKGLVHLDDVLLVDQSPIVRTPRSTPAVYMGLFEDVRALFAAEPAAQARGLKAGYFSFNSGEGRCQRCKGLGQEKVEMQFLSDIYVPCAICEGSRYTPEALNIKYLGYSMADLLALDIKQSLAIFEKVNNVRGKRIAQRLALLVEVGLGHLGLGQALNTLSGGENQRLKLARLLSEAIKSDGRQAEKGKMLILDEPGTGLHYADLETLIAVFHRLVEQGHSLLVIEHNLELIKCADHVIDLGPEGGKKGGQIVAQGTPEQLVEQAQGYTAAFLAELLSMDWQGNHKPLAAVLHDDEQGGAAGVIALRGARHHQLKNIDVDIKRKEMTVVTGLSGSGKSTLAFDIIFAEGQKRFMDVMSPYARQFTEQMETPDIDRLTGLPPTVAIEQNRSRGGCKSTVGTVTEVWQFLRLLFAKLGTPHCPHCLVPVGRRDAGEIFSLVLDEVGQEPESLLIAAPVVRNRKGHYADLARWAEKKKYPLMRADGRLVSPSEFEPLDRYANHDIDIVLAQLEVTSNRILMNGKECDFHDLRDVVNHALQMGDGFVRLLIDEREQLLGTRLSCPSCGESFAEPEPASFSFNSPRGWCPRCMGHGRVSKVSMKEEEKMSQLEMELAYDREMEKAAAKDAESVLCPECHGARLNQFALHVLLFGYNLSQIGDLNASAALRLIQDWHFEGRDGEIARNVLTEICQRLRFLEQVGLGYLSLNRSATTLSGGETQRIRLSAQLGSELRGVLYVLDEPTIGLHPMDNERLLKSLDLLKERGNTLLVVEHDIETMERADTIIDLGPGAGVHGGEIVAQGSFAQLAQEPESVTGLALQHLQKHPYCGKYLPMRGVEYLDLKGCHLNNLKDVNLRLPRARLTVVTGPSGAGKTSLIAGCLAPALREQLGSKLRADQRGHWSSSKGLDSVRALYQVDQSPIGKTPRSTPATYIGIFDEIRKLFAMSADARRLGFGAGRFSFNTAAGHCEMCKGTGMQKQEMDFLPPCSVPCDSCRGARYNSRTLQVRYKGKTIADVLGMSMEEAAEFFASQPRLADPLRLLCETGLSYLTLGQASNTLSGGEAQRIKLVAELIKGRRAALNAIKKGRALPQDLYLIEEPTIGLHPHDVRLLIAVLRRLVEMGNTVVVIEHNLELICEADYVIDMGPGAGEQGGSIVAQGTIKQLLALKQSDSPTIPYIQAEMAP
ncbi:MAG: excinuclease ABC subunit UvrA [Akkermansia sp.]